MHREATTRIVADPSICAGSGLCSHIAPKYFDSSDGVVAVLREELDEADSAGVVEAVASCPTQALLLDRSDTSN
jgi:ferredoxin